MAAQRRAPPDARHAERRLVGADAGAVGRRHVRQRARRRRRAVRDAAARQLMAQFPGFLAAAGRPARTARSGSARADWRQLADDDLRRVRRATSRGTPTALQLDAYRWGVPPQARARRGGRAARSARRSSATALPRSTRPADRSSSAGRRSTPDGYEVRQDGREGVRTSTPSTTATDASRPTSALLPGVRTWPRRCRPRRPARDARTAFEAYLELLQTGRHGPAAAARRAGRHAERRPSPPARVQEPAVPAAAVERAACRRARRLRGGARAAAARRSGRRRRRRCASRS